MASATYEPVTNFKPIAPSPTDLAEILRVEESLVVPHFTTSDALEIGLLLQTRLRLASKPALISIQTPSGLSAPFSPARTLFQCSAKSGVQPDNEIWVSRKAQTVFRFGVSSWYMGQKLKGDEKLFAAKFGMSEEVASGYAIHGGAVPVRMAGLESPVGVVVVSGLSQDEDHGVVVEVLREWIRNQ